MSRFSVAPVVLFAVTTAACVVQPGPSSSSVSPPPSPSYAAPPPGGSGSGSASATPGDAPSTPWLTPATYPALPARVEGLLVKATIDKAELIDSTLRQWNYNDEYYELLVPGQRGRIVRLASGALFGVADAKHLGIDGVAAIVEVELDARSTGCAAHTPHIVCARTLRRLDAGATFAIDAGKALAELIATYGPAAPDGRDLAERARHGLASYPDPAGSQPGGGPGRRPLGPTGFAAAWSPARKELDVLVVARAQRVTVRRVVSTQPGAGSFGCDAPYGADCAPQCRPPAFEVTSAHVVEAGVRAVFDHTGARTRLDDAGVGAHPPRVLSSVDEPCR
jgi:hypothetical protein